MSLSSRPNGIDQLKAEWFLKLDKLVAKLNALKPRDTDNNQSDLKEWNVLNEKAESTHRSINIYSQDSPINRSISYNKINNAFRDLEAYIREHEKIPRTYMLFKEKPVGSETHVLDKKLTP